MTLDDLLLRLVPMLDRAPMPYMITGSVASSLHGAPRSTPGLDVVIAPTQRQLLALVHEFPSAIYYVDSQQVIRALANRSQFNVIEFASGWKIDFIIAEASEYGGTALARRTIIDIAGVPAYVASPEDILIVVQARRLRSATAGRSGNSQNPRVKSRQKVRQRMGRKAWAQRTMGRSG